MIWNAVIFGPHDTPFEDGTFKLTIEFTEEYPNKPPTVRFVSKMFHPNVYADGGICLDILQNRWSPTYDVSAILTSIQVKKYISFVDLLWNYSKKQKTKKNYSVLSFYICSRCSVIRIQIHRPIRWQLNCIRKTAENTRNEWKLVWNKVL